MKIRCQLPIKLSSDDPYYDVLLRHYNLIKRKDTEIVIKDVPTAFSDPKLQAYSGLRFLNDVEILKSILMAEQEGFHGVSIACFFDPGLNAARQLLKIPVTGLAESSLHLASMMGNKFAIITKQVEFIPDIEANITKYGLRSKAIERNPVRALSVSPKEIYDGFNLEYATLVENFKKVAAGCVEDGAEVLIAGCGLISPILYSAGLTEVQGACIVDPLSASLKLTEALIDLNQVKMPTVSRKLSYLDVSKRDIQRALASLD